MEGIIESQKTLNSLSKQASLCRSKIQSKEYERKVDMYTLRELGLLPDSTVIYKASGKMFMQSNITEMSNQLTNEISSAKDEVGKLEELQKGLIEKIKDHEGRLRETLRKMEISGNNQ